MNCYNDLGIPKHVSINIVTCERKSAKPFRYRVFIFSAPRSYATAICMLNGMDIDATKFWKTTQCLSALYPSVCQAANLFSNQISIIQGCRNRSSCTILIISNNFMKRLCLCYFQQHLHRGNKANTLGSQWFAVAQTITVSGSVFALLFLQILVLAQELLLRFRYNFS